MSELIVLDIFWDRRLVRDDTGRQFFQLRGQDYQAEWVKLGHGYGRGERSVDYYGEPCFEKLYGEIDFETFRILDTHLVDNPYDPKNQRVDLIYFVDQKRVYLSRHLRSVVVLDGADPATFRIVNADRGLTTDGLIDFVYDERLPYRIAELQLINSLYGRVGDAVYFSYSKRVACDAATFGIIHEKVVSVARDKDYVYFRDQIVAGADPQSFAFLPDCVGDRRPDYRDMDIDFYATDRKRAYFVSTPYRVKPIRTKSLANFHFRVIDGVGYAFDASYCYARGKRKPLSQLPDIA